MAATDMLRGRQTATRTLTNKSGGAVAQGDVVVIGDAATDNSFTTTTTASFNARMVGVAMEAIASNAAGLVAISGYVPIVNSAVGGLTREHFLFTSTVAKEATGSATRAAGAFGQVLETGVDPEAIIWGMPDSSVAGASGSITASGYTQNTARLLGRTTAAAGAIEEMTVGSGLSLAAGALTATGSATYVGCKTSAAAFAVTTATWTASSMTAADTEDSDGFHDPASNADRHTVPAGKAGVYHVTVDVFYAFNATGYRYVGIGKNAAASPDVGSIARRADQAQGHGLQFSADVRLAVGDYLRHFVYQDSTGNLNATPTFTMHLVGA